MTQPTACSLEVEGSVLIEASRMPWLYRRVSNNPRLSIYLQNYRMLILEKLCNSGFFLWLFVSNRQWAEDGGLTEENKKFAGHLEESPAKRSDRGDNVQFDCPK
jgi:hypothetical protein